jgi:hypothetical protein
LNRSGRRGGLCPPFFLKKNKRRRCAMKGLEKEIKKAIKLMGKIYERIKEEKIDFTNSSLDIDSLLLIVKKIEKAYYQEN